MKSINKLFILTLVLFAFACGTKDNEKSNSEAEAPKRTIHEASFFGDLESIKAHIAYGSDLNVKDDYGSTPLNIAITFNKMPVAMELINAGADLEMASADGSTPLISAAFYGRTEIVKSLLEHGANINATNQYQATALTNASTPFEQLKPVYDQISKDLGPLGFKLNYEELQKERKLITDILEEANTKDSE